MTITFRSTGWCQVVCVCERVLLSFSFSVGSAIRMSVGGNQRVTVAVRTRPVLREGAQMHTQEKFEMPAIQRIGDTALRVEATRPGEPVKSSTFSFDYIFDQESTQLEVYEECVVDMVDAALVGVNASLLAYGQTGSGKTFSVLGDVKPNPLEADLLTPNSGIFLRVLSDLMDYKIRRAANGWHVIVGLSCVEIYNENIRDLFGGRSDAPPPPIKAVMLQDEVLLPNLIVKEMTSLQAVFTEIQLAIARRASRATESNAASSRSHCLFFIDILQQAKSAPAPSMDIIDPRRSKSSSDKKSDAVSVKRTIVTGNASSPPSTSPHEMQFQGTVYHVGNQKEPVYASKIILADLAGSERIARSGVTGVGLAEATSINSSLTALGNVVHSLHEGGYVSYRNSNLTRLLMPTFSHPSSRVLLLAQCAPTQLTFEETVSTLHFANKVKAMKVTTVTGVEAEKIQFDYVESAKAYDAIAADLRIFAVASGAKANVIRRSNQSATGATFHSSTNAAPKERLAEMETKGIMKKARDEKEAIAKAEAKEKAQFEASLATMVGVEVKKITTEHGERMKEVRNDVAGENRYRQGYKSDELMREFAVGGSLLQLNEEVMRSRLMKTFYKAHSAMCVQEAGRSDAKLKVATSSLLNTQSKASVLPVDSSVAKEDQQYSVSSWYHCTGKRFFADVIQNRELEASLLHLVGGNGKLARWRAKHDAKS